MPIDVNALSVLAAEYAKGMTSIRGSECSACSSASLRAPNMCSSRQSHQAAALSWVVRKRSLPCGHRGPGQAGVC